MIDQKKRWQILFRDMGFYNLKIDGDWGNGSKTAHQQAIKAGIVGENIFDLPVCFSNKVQPDFIAKTIDISSALKMNQAGPDQMMSCMGWESGETFSPSIRNGAGSGAVGLIQWMHFVALTYFYSQKDIKKMSKEEKKVKGLECCDKLASMTAVQQLDYVFEYFKPYAGKLDTLADVYSAIIYPKAVGKPEDYILFQKETVAYRQNMGFDVNTDGFITKNECTKKVVEKLCRGFKLLNK